MSDKKADLIMALVGISSITFLGGLVVGYKFFTKIERQKCVVTIDQALGYLNRLPPQVTSATVQIPFVREEGIWKGYRQ